MDEYSFQKILDDLSSSKLENKFWVALKMANFGSAEVRSARKTKTDDSTQKAPKFCVLGLITFAA